MLKISIQLQVVQLFEGQQSALVLDPIGERHAVLISVQRDCAPKSEPMPLGASQGAFPRHEAAIVPARLIDRLAGL